MDPSVFTPHTLNAISQVPTSAIPSPADPNMPTAGGPNWWQKLLPTAGGILGGIGGEALDVFGGGIGGAAAGGAAGKWLENLLSGQNTGGGVLESAIQSGVGQGIGGAIAGAGSKALGGVSDVTGNLATKGAAETAQAVENVPWAGIAGSTAAKKADLEGTLAVMKRYGLDATPETLAKVIPQVSGKEGAVLSDLVRGAMEKSTAPVDLSGAVELANNIAGSPELASEGATVGKAFTKTVNSVLGLDKVGTPITAQTAPDIYQARQLLMNKAYSPGVNEALSNAYHDVANSLDNALTKSGVDQVAVANGLTPEQFQTLHDVSPSLANDAAAASQQNIGALRTLQKPFVNADNLVKAQAYHAGGQLPGALDEATAKALQASKGGLIPAETMQTLAGTHPVVATGAKAINLATNPTTLAKLSDLTGKAAASKILPTLTRAGAIAASNLPNDIGTPAPATGEALTSNMGNTMQPSAPPANPLSQLYEQLLAQERAGAGLTPNSGSLVGTLNTLAPALQHQQLATPVLANALSTFGQAGGAQGMGGGLLSRLTGLIPGTAANTYQRSQEATAATLASLLGITPQQAALLMPQLMQSQQTAANPTAALQSIMGGIGTAPTGGSVLPTTAQ